MINDHYKINFRTMLMAAENDDLCLMECTETATGKPVMAICMVNRNERGEYEMVPVARMFDGNPYEELTPPTLEN